MEQTYDVHLEIFEGPLDLLLYLIKKDDLDIYDIPISNITAEYLEYIQLMKELNVNIAGEFLVMAATLMEIKSQTLLPSKTIEEQEGPDPKAELISKLIEYQKYKQAAVFLSQQETKQQGIFFKSSAYFSEDDFMFDVNIFDLIASFKEIISALPEEVKEIIHQEIPIEQKIHEIMDLLEGKKYITFSEIIKKEITRKAMIVTFLALLELIRLKQIVARQARLFGEIRIYRVII